MGGPALMVMYVILGAIGPPMGKGAKSELPPYLTTLRAASPIRPACESMCYAEFKDKYFSDPPNRSPVGGLLTMFSSLPRIIRALIRRNKHGTKSGLSTAGDHVLDDLGINVVSGSLSQSRHSLFNMLVVHSAMALLGLILQRKE